MTTATNLNEKAFSYFDKKQNKPSLNAQCYTNCIRHRDTIGGNDYLHGITDSIQMARTENQELIATTGKDAKQAGKCMVGHIFEWLLGRQISLALLHYSSPWFIETRPKEKKRVTDYFRTTLYKGRIYPTKPDLDFIIRQVNAPVTPEHIVLVSAKTCAKDRGSCSSFWKRSLEDKADSENVYRLTQLFINGNKREDGLDELFIDQVKHNLFVFDYKLTARVYSNIPSDWRHVSDLPNILDTITSSLPC